MPALAEPITAPELPVVEPAHDGIELLGIGTVISGLTPALLISVEPSGIVPPFSVKFELVPRVESGEAVPADVVFVSGAQFDMDGDPVELSPPPSNVDVIPVFELVPDIEVMPGPLEPAVPKDMPAGEETLVLQFETGAGLKPPGSISVAPNGIPVALFDPLDALEPSTPSGDVAPMPALVIALCAWAAPQPTRIAATMRDKSLMERLRC
jgi:hypothetical protein